MRYLKVTAQLERPRARIGFSAAVCRSLSQAFFDTDWVMSHLNVKTSKGTVTVDMGIERRDGHSMDGEQAAYIYTALNEAYEFTVYDDELTDDLPTEWRGIPRAELGRHAFLPHGDRFGREGLSD